MKNFFALLPGFLFCLSAFACECEGLKDFTAYYKKIPFIFEGRVTALEHREAELAIVATIEVKEVHKGKRLSTVQVFTADNSGMCGFDFELNLSYLIFCYQYRPGEPNSGKFETNWCQPNILMTDTARYRKMEKQLCAAEGNVTREKVTAIQGTWKVESGVFSHPFFKVENGITQYVYYHFPCAHLLPNARIEFSEFRGKIYKHDYNVESTVEDTCNFSFTILEGDVFSLHQSGMDVITICPFKEMTDSSFILLPSMWQSEIYPSPELKFKRVK